MNILAPTIRSFIIGASVLVLSACAVGTEGQVENTPGFDTRLQHPITVGREQVSMTIDLPQDGASLRANDSGRLNGFVRDFIVRGRGLVMIESNQSDLAIGLLEAQGLRSNELVFVNNAALPAGHVILTYSANKANLPDCGKWDDETYFTGSNAPQSNFGCANRRNIGAIVANPGDLIRSQPLSGRGAARQDSVLDGYNAGETIGPKTDPIDTQSVSGVN